jgi:hypothetical protein
MNHLLRQARAANAIPRVHGNGFIQLDLSPTARLHVWGHKDIPKQKTDTPIHNHRFSFTSFVLRGTMMSQMYEVELGRTHRCYTAKVRKDQDTVLEPTHELVTMRPTGLHVVTAGHFYPMIAGEIHESIVQELTVTVILKSGPTLAQGGPTPTVYVPIDVTPDNTFDRYSVPPSDLWKIITESCR